MDKITSTGGRNVCTKTKPAILSKSDISKETRPVKNVTALVGSAHLSLPKHNDIFSVNFGEVIEPGDKEVLIILTDGSLFAHAAMLAGISPFLNCILAEAWEREERPITISLPHISRQQMGLLLSLLYTGQANLLDGELTSLVTLTHLLKLVTIPVAITEEKWLERWPVSRQLCKQQDIKAVITFIPTEMTTRGRPAKTLCSSNPEGGYLSSSTETLSIPTVEQKATFPADMIYFSHLPQSTERLQQVQMMEEESDSEGEELIEEIQVFVTQEGEVERLEVIGQNNEHLDNGQVFLEVKQQLKEEDQPVKDKDCNNMQEQVEANIHNSEVEHFEKYSYWNSKSSGDTEHKKELTSVDVTDNKDYREMTKTSVNDSNVVAQGEAVTVTLLHDREIHQTVLQGNTNHFGNGIILQGSEIREQNHAVALDGGDTFTVVHAEEGEGLDTFISVAEAFEKSQQPDFNDIASPVVDGTDTDKHLVRNCCICDKALLGRNALGRHMKNVHPKVFGPYRCKFAGCAKMIESGVKMLSHIYHHTGGKTKVAQETPSFVCTVPECEEVFVSGSRLAEHMKKNHDMSNPALQKITFSCNAGVSSGCFEVFLTARNFIKHMKEAHNMKPWYCAECDKRFMERQNLQFHLMGHGDRKNFNCDICNKSFSNPRQLYTHRALHLGKRFLCQECGYKARSSANLRGHVKSKHEARSHTCELCQKKFSSGNNLRNHLRIHTGETPYGCELCGVKFKRMHHLHSHIESKMHVDVMEKCRRNGHPIPQHLDPVRRSRGRQMVEDGPVTLTTQPQFEISENWPSHQVVLVEESVGDFVIPVEETQVEIIQSTDTFTSSYK